MTLRYFLATELYNLIYWLFCDLFCWLTLANFSPVNGFTVIGVVIVLLPGCPSCFTRSSPGCNFGLNSRFVSNGISTVLFLVYPFWSVFNHIIHWLFDHFSCVWILNSWFTWYFFRLICW